MHLRSAISGLLSLVAASANPDHRDLARMFNRKHEGQLALLLRLEIKLPFEDV